MAVVLVTGITGQDGGYLAEQLVAAGDRVHGTVAARPTSTASPRTWLTWGTPWRFTSPT